MDADQLRDLARRAANRTGYRKILVLGSRAVHGSLPGVALPPIATTSEEADLAVVNDLSHETPHVPALDRLGWVDDHPLAGLVFHELRHTAASLAIAQGAHPPTVKERLGHSSITVTMDRYGHLFPAQDAALAEALDKVLRASLDDFEQARTAVRPLHP